MQKGLRRVRMSYIFMRDVPYLNQRCPISQPKMSYISAKDVLYLMEALIP